MFFTPEQERQSPLDRTLLVCCGSRTMRAEQLLYRNVQRFRGGLVSKAHRILSHSALGLRVIKKKKIAPMFFSPEQERQSPLD